ncbi:MAG: hypothetical protein BAJALOKI2v1_160053 [Promethearchaeota archaeon]|nr:MAG: hypothetical protein BAJALOKI2v1_160053 [Candidatus Lokiarchaeota archaeon]
MPDKQEDEDLKLKMKQKQPDEELKKDVQKNKPKREERVREDEFPKSRREKG